MGSTSLDGIESICPLLSTALTSKVKTSKLERIGT